VREGVLVRKVKMGVVMKVWKAVINFVGPSHAPPTIGELGQSRCRPKANISYLTLNKKLSSRQPFLRILDREPSSGQVMGFLYLDYF
jgi:hypothetical protein